MLMKILKDLLIMMDDVVLLDEERELLLDIRKKVDNLSSSIKLSDSEISNLVSIDDESVIVKQIDKIIDNNDKIIQELDKMLNNG